MMQRMKYRIRFLTPAFLGNAEQSGQWRTPPFKALLRQWWRVVWAAKCGYPQGTAAMRDDEGRLFGNAWLDGGFRKSAVRMRLSKWADGSLTKGQWGNQDIDRKISHPEVRQPVGPLLYLGYGPLTTKRVGKDFATLLKGNAAIQAGDAADLSIAAPESDIVDIRNALALMDAYGTVGGRSRNGWGSFEIEALDQSPAPETAVHEIERKPSSQNFIRPWGDALGLDWPHAIGTDDTGPLVWRTAEPYDDWKKLMRVLAILKIGLRTMFVFPKPPHTRPLDRHWLSYPIVKKHQTRQWGSNLRLPNSLRFKVRSDPDDPERLRGVVFHVPCLPPADFRPDEHAIKNVWRTAHELLDELTQPPVGRHYMMISDGERRERLKPSLDTLTLARSPE